MPTSPATVTIDTRDDFSWRLLSVAASLCPVCQDYASRRIRVIALATVVAADRAGVDPKVLFHRYMGSVHARHLDGGSLSTRKSTPVRRRDGVSHLTVHRICNGCGADLGDANAEELDAAQAGRPLPDVRLECGCFGREERVA